MSENIEQPLPRTFEEFNEQRKAAFIRVKDYKQAGNRLVGFLCSYTPLEIIDAAGAASVALCGTSDEVIPEAEKVLPANLCPLIKSTYGFAYSQKCPFTYFSDMIIGEEVQRPERGYNVSQAIQVLADKGGYREAIEERASRFAELYPKLKRGALVAGFIVPVILVLIFSFTNGEKIVVLATWIIWVLLIIGFLMVIEYMRFSLQRQVELGSLSDEAIREQLVERQAARLRRKKRAQQNRRDKLMRKARRRKHETKQAIANVADTSQADADGIATLVQAMNAAGNTGTASNANPNGNSERSNA